MDEVLAVGDAAFQKKCIGKMDEVSRSHGRTVLFVSHNLAALRGLCTRAILLDHGAKVFDGDVNDAVRTYLESEAGSPAVFVWSEADAPCQGGFTLRKVSILDAEGNPAATVPHDHPFTVAIEYEAQRELPGLRVGFLIQNSEGTEICGSNDFHAATPAQRIAGRFVSRCEFPSYLLNEGRYHLRFGAETPHGGVNLFTPYCLTFAIEDTERHGETRHRLPGVLRPRLAWSIAGKPVA